jgi:hypothetical protein
MKRYVAYLTPEPGSQPALRRDKFLSIRIEFTVDPDIPYNGPATLVEDMVRAAREALPKVHIEYRLIEDGVEVVLPADGEPLPCEPLPDTPEPETPGVEVRNDHYLAVVFPGREYRVKTMIPGVERVPRYSRMHFAGLQYPDSPRTSALTFSARGPDRTHSGRYGGTQNVPMSAILEMTEVERDVARRYVSLRERPVDDRYDGKGPKP